MMPKYRYLRSRKGITLVEVICALAILALVTLAVLGAVSLSRTTVKQDNTKDAASAQAQTIMDAMMSDLKALPQAKPADIEKDLAALGAVYTPVWPFQYENGEKQCYFVPTLDANGVSGYKVYVGVFYAGGTACVTLNQYVAYQGGDTP